MALEIENRVRTAVGLPELPVAAPAKSESAKPAKSDTTR